MKISYIELNQEKEGINPFVNRKLGNIVLLTGSNGSGKSRILRMIDSYITNLKSGIDNKELTIKITDHNKKEYPLTTDNVQKIQIANYSHYDANLQSFKEFTPYVIHKAKDILKECNYEETALNSLLLISDMAHGYSKEFEDKSEFEKFSRNLKENFDIELTEENGDIRLFGFDTEESSLSPGQQYLLRIAVACYQNDVDDKLIFFLDEPELHLHPSALIKAITQLRNKFKNSQFWISTHSLALIANMTLAEPDATVLYLDKGKVSLFRSDSEKLLTGLLGEEDNKVMIRTLISTPDEYAINKFATECYFEPDTLPAKPGDPENETIRQILKAGDVVVDYGVGKGRFFEGLGLDCRELASQINYFAYDPSPRDADECKFVMNKYGSDEKYYFNDIDKLISTVNHTADYVILVNVLHEIPPWNWASVFSNVNNLLKDGGELIIVELEELKTGEAPYNKIFLMITENAANILFGKDNIEFCRHPKKEQIVKFTVKKEGLDVSQEKVDLAVNQIHADALKNIKKVKNSDYEKKFRSGIKLTFWLHQYANASLILSGEIKPNT